MVAPVQELSRSKNVCKKTALMKKSKRRTKKKTTPSREFKVESVNGIEIAHTTTSTQEKLSDAHLQNILRLSEIATRQFETEGRGGFLVVSEVNPNQAVYISAKILFESINKLIPVDGDQNLRKYGE